MTPLLRIKIAKILTGAIFWLPVAVLYFKYRGIPDEDVYTIFAFYAICMAVLEFPTGVIGDYFSQMFSVKVGYLLVGLSFIVASFQLPIWAYLITQFTAALGLSMTSGSDIAILNQYSNDIENDIKQTKILTQLAIVFTTLLGGFLFVFNPALPIFITGVFFLFSFLLISTLKDHPTVLNSKYEGNIFNKAIDGVKLTFKNIALRDMVLLSAFTIGFELSLKFILNDLFLVFELPVYLYGVLMGLFSFVMIFGMSTYSKSKPKVNIYFLLLFPTLLAIIGLSQKIVFTVVFLVLLYMVRGLIDTYFDIAINNEVPQENKASIISLRSLILRTFSAVYTFGIGFIISEFSVFKLFIFTSIFFFVITTIYIIQIQKAKSIEASDYLNIRKKS